MAQDSVVRLRLESQEYDAKLKRATEGIRDYARGCHEAGGTLEYVDEGVMDFIKALGKMDTVAKTAKGEVTELTRSFTELNVLYQRMSEEEKKSPPGKELAKQLGLLKDRINETKGQLQNANNEINNTGGFLDKLKDKFVINIDAMKLFDLGLRAVKGGLNVAKDAFFSSEQNIDEWGRTTSAAEAVYEGFLYSINTGDIGGYLSRIDEIKKAAVEAYNELDRLATQKAINNSATQGQRVENERMRTMLRTGRYIAPADGRAPAPGLKEGDLLSKAQLAALARQLQNGQQNLNSFIRADITQAGKSIDALYKVEANKLGLSLSDFRKGTSNMAEFDRRIEGYHKYMEWEKQHTSTALGSSMYGGFTMTARTGEKNPYQRYAGWGVFQDDGETFTKINNLINERAGYQSQLYSNAGANYRAINKGTGGGGGGRGGGGGTPYEAQTMVPLVGIDQPWWQRFGGSTLQGSIAQIGAPAALQMQSAGWLERGQRNPEIAKIADTMDESSKLIADMSGGVSNIVSGVETLGIKVPDALKKGLSILQGLTSILTGISAILTLINAKQTAQAIGALIPGMHTGGVVRAAMGYTVPGNYGFDAVPALLTSGETVLTRAQTAGLARALKSQGESQGTPQARVSGEQIYITLTNYMNRRGYGETLISR